MLVSGPRCTEKPPKRTTSQSWKPSVLEMHKSPSGTKLLASNVNMIAISGTQALLIPTNPTEMFNSGDTSADVTLLPTEPPSFWFLSQSHKIFFKVNSYNHPQHLMHLFGSCMCVWPNIMLNYSVVNVTMIKSHCTDSDRNATTTQNYPHVQWQDPDLSSAVACYAQLLPACLVTLRNWRKILYLS